MRQILLDHIRRYPLAEAQDFLKLARQSALGGAHLGGGSGVARAAAKAELTRSCRPRRKPDSRPRWSRSAAGWCG